MTSWGLPLLGPCRRSQAEIIEYHETIRAHGKDSVAIYGSGQWTIPAGYLELDETVEEGARRAEAYRARESSGRTESGGRAAGFSRRMTPGEVDTTHGRILYLEDVSVSFDGFRAINNLSLDIAPGELRCIIGPNGAGKTTLFDVISGLRTPDAGRRGRGGALRLPSPGPAAGHVAGRLRAVRQWVWSKTGDAAWIVRSVLRPGRAMPPDSTGEIGNWGHSPISARTAGGSTTAPGNR